MEKERRKKREGKRPFTDQALVSVCVVQSLGQVAH